MCGHRGSGVRHGMGITAARAARAAVMARMAADDTPGGIHMS